MTPRRFALVLATLYFMLVFLAVDHDPAYAFYPAIAVGTAGAFLGGEAFANLLIDWGFYRR